MCGPSQVETQVSQEQNDFYRTLTDHYNQIFPEQQNIVSALTNRFQPILAAGQNQRGFSDEERNSMMTSATEGTAADYARAQTGTAEMLAARGGGNQFTPNGMDAQLLAQNQYAAAAEQSQQRQSIIQADYATGRANFAQAAAALGSTAGLVDPNAAANSTTGAGSAASTTAHNITEAQNSGWQMAAGALGSVAGNVTYGAGKGWGLG